MDTVDDITDAKIIIAVVKGGEFSARSGLSTVSIAKKHPATAALKPEAIPAADPAAIRAILRSLLFSIISAHPIAQDLPISTLGPSGPNEHPVPKVIAAWMALIAGKIALMKSIPSL